MGTIRFPFLNIEAMSVVYFTKTIVTIVILILLPTSCNALNVVITGSSQGIGLDAAKRLINDGHVVYHACRNIERARVAVENSGGGIPMVCDLTDFVSIRTFAQKFINDIEEKGKLDVLCLNAGIAPSTKSTVPKLTKDGYEECIGTNHIGHFLLANLLLPHLSSSGTTSGVGRIVVTASSVHDPESPGGTINGEGGATLGDLSGLGVRLDQNNNNNNNNKATMPNGDTKYDGRKVYNDSKLCNVLFCREANRRWGGESNVAIRSFNPGFIPTSGLFRAPRNDNWLGATIFAFVTTYIFRIAVPIEVGGERLAYMITADDTEVPPGSYYSAPVGSKAATYADGFQQATISKEASDDDLATKLWDRSIEIVGL